MSPSLLVRAPGGEPVSFSEIREIASMRDPVASLRERLARLLAVEAGRIEFRRSGRDALRSLFLEWQSESGRDEVVIPGYTCFSVPAAAVAAGMKVRLVDVDERGRIDLEDFAAMPLDKVAGVVVCNLFGMAESIDEIQARASGAGVRVLDDAAQSLGARDAKGQLIGARGTEAVLSFGRGKPLQGLGGGALVRAGAPEAATGHVEEARDVARAGLGTLVRSLIWDAAQLPLCFSVLARIPALGIGTTPFEPEFGQGPIDPGNAAIAAAQSVRFEQRAQRRAHRALALAEAIRSASDFVPLVDENQGGVYARLAVRAPTAESRERALADLRAAGEGVSAFYPSSLADLAPLAPHRRDSGTADLRGSRSLAARILTLPTNVDLAPRRRARIASILAQAAAHTRKSG